MTPSHRRTGPIGVYPGSFDPPTVAHLAVADAAVRAAGLRRLDLVLSRDALGKASVDESEFRRRRLRLESAVRRREHLDVAVRAEKLIADLSRGYDAVILGADKWRQVLDARWYRDVEERDRALQRLPLVLIAPRGSDELRDLGRVTGARGPEVRVLDLPRSLREVSSTAVRRGDPGASRWIAPMSPGDGDPI